MPFNNQISRGDASALIPQEISNEIIKAVPEASAVMRLARRLQNMSSNQRRMPVMSALATAYFVSGDTGLKQTSELNWESKYVDAEELAVIVPVPEAVLSDSSFDIWAECKPALVEALGLAVDQAVLYGTNIPASWTTNLGAAGLVARCTAASHVVSLAAYADLYEALLGETVAGVAGSLMLIEADGFMSSGDLGHVSMRGKLRNCRSTTGELIFKTTMQDAARYELDGAPIAFPMNGAINSAASLMISGDWNQLVYSMRQDITYKILDQAVIQDAAGNIIYNLAQQDMIALRAVMRLGFALPNPINRMQSVAANRCQFSVLTAEAAEKGNIMGLFPGKFKALIDFAAGWRINGTTVTATAAELNALAGQGVTATDAAKLHAVTATAAEVNRISAAGVAADGLGFLGVARFTFDASVAANQSIAAHGTGVTLPANAIVVGGFFDVNTVFTSAGGNAGTVAIHVEGAGDIQAAAAVSGVPYSTIGRKAIVPKANTPESTAVKATVAREITCTVAGQILSAGKLSGFLYYVVSVASA